MAIPSPYRLPGDDTPWRKNAVLAFEAEFDTFVDTNMHWGVYDMFFIHENYAYYYKPRLEEYVNNFDEQEILAKTSFVEAITDYLGHEASTLIHKKDLNWIRNEVFAKNPPGLPKLVLETPNFFQLKIECDNPNNMEHINIDDLTRPTLDKIKQYIGGDYNPFLDSKMDLSVYNFDGRYYCMDPFAYNYNPTPQGQIGIFLEPETESLKYENAMNNSYFFTFQRITPQQREFALNLGKLYTSSPQRPNNTIIKEYFSL
jgi:hypothetical protein